MPNNQDNLIEQKSDDNTLTPEEAALGATYDRFSKAISNLFDLVNGSEARKNFKTRIELINAIRDVADMLNENLPCEGLNEKKGPYDLQDVAITMAYRVRWYGSHETLSDKAALELAYAYKLMLQNECDEFNLDTSINDLTELAANEYEKKQTEMHCAEADSALQEYKRLILAYYFNNDPYDIGKTFGKGICDVVAPLGINLNNHDIFEEIVLKLSGVLTLPAGCRFDHHDPLTLLISVKGISENDAEKFTDFLRTKVQDSNASFRYIADEPNQESPDELKRHTLDNAHQFTVDIKKAKEYLLPLFVDEINRLMRDNPSALDAYRDKPGEDHSISGMVVSTARSIYAFFAGSNSDDVAVSTPESSPETSRRFGG